MKYSSLTSRRDFLKMVGVSAAAVTTSSVVEAAEKASKGKRPNIILFLTDQQRLSAIGAYGK
ncbi:MAG: twin-arginine translocation signal domain-containing protein, partial [Anaerohalosphaera sp.]|nr:twin-arginine translocation signal domain-containing protein [Anaerohalosphaera sp.]